jgi:DNA replication protein DnaC
MPPDAMVATLKTLKLFGMAQAVEELATQGSPAYHQAEAILVNLLKAEVAEREVRSVNYQMKIARFPAYRDLAGFDFAQSVVNEALVRQLHRGDFMAEAHNIVLIGGPGTGKTHLATAISVQAIMHARRRVRFFSTVDLVNSLEQEKLAGKAGQLAQRLVPTDLVILDELGYLPFSQTGGALLFHLISKLYEHTIDGRPRFAKPPIDDGEKVEIAAIDPGFRLRPSPLPLMECAGRYLYSLSSLSLPV